MSDPQIHLDIIIESLEEAEREINLLNEHGHSSDDKILKGILGMKLIMSKVKELLNKQKGAS